MPQLTNRQKVDIIHDYTINLVTMIELAKRYGKSRQAIYKIIKAAQVDTAKEGGIEVSCSCCQQIFRRHRCLIRKAKHVFCSNECYHAYLEAGNGRPYIHNRQGQRLARIEASRFIVLREGYVIHHEDRNTLNNDPHNLMVFRCNGDHVRHHRGFDVEPVWDGTKLPLLVKYPKKPKDIN